MKINDVQSLIGKSSIIIIIHINNSFLLTLYDISVFNSLFLCSSEIGRWLNRLNFRNRFYKKKSRILTSLLKILENLNRRLDAISLRKSWAFAKQKPHLIIMPSKSLRVSILNANIHCMNINVCRESQVCHYQ